MNESASRGISARLRDLSEATGLPHTWLWLSRQTGIHYDRLMRLRYGRSRFQTSETVAISVALGTALSDLFGNVPIEPDGSSGRKNGRQPRRLGESVA